MANTPFKLFSADGSNSADPFLHTHRYSQLTIGKVGSVDFGGGTLLIQKTTLDGSGGLHDIDSLVLADFDALETKTVRLELTAGEEIVVTLTGSLTPDLYIEHRNQRDRA